MKRRLRLLSQCPLTQRLTMVLSYECLRKLHRWIDSAMHALCELETLETSIFSNKMEVIHWDTHIAGHVCSRHQELAREPTSETETTASALSLGVATSAGINTSLVTNALFSPGQLQVIWSITVHVDVTSELTRLGKVSLGNGKAETFWVG